MNLSAIYVTAVLIVLGLAAVMAAVRIYRQRRHIKELRAERAKLQGMFPHSWVDLSANFPAEFGNVLVYGEPSANVPATLSLEAVHFSVTAPLTVMPDSTFELNFWAHAEEQRREMLERAKQIMSVHDDRDLLLRSEGPFELSRGARLTVRITADGLTIEPIHKAVLWLGEIASATFLVEVPVDAKQGAHPGAASIRLNGLQIAKMHFLLTVGKEVQSVSSVQTHTAMHKNAFASYASEDRDLVIARVQGMEKALPSMKVFVDVVNLRSGQYWEKELFQLIPRADVLYLFWCRHAKDSPWVEKEWRCALGIRGLDFIDPVPLESPQFAPPPPELAAKHFNDPLLAFLESGGHGRGPESALR